MGYSYRFNAGVIMSLNEKQEKFAQSYILHRNATEAARAAGYAKESAYNQGYRLLQNEEVKERIEDLEKELTTDVDVVTEIEQQYTYAKNNGHTNSAIKALELLSRVRGNKSDNETNLNSEELEEQIVNCLNVLGKTKIVELLHKCNFNQPTELNKESHQQHQKKILKEPQE